MQTLAYADMPSVRYTVEGHSSEGNLVSAAVGMTVTSGRFNVSVEYGSSSTGLHNFEGHALRITLRGDP